MIKRSAAVLCLLGIASAGHNQHHRKHVYSEAERQFLSIDDAQLDGVKSNADICSFWIDSSFYLLKPIILSNGSYSANYANGSIDFNICDPLYNPAPQCQGAFACLKYNGVSSPLSGTDFKEDIIGTLDVNRNDSKGGLTLQFTGASTKCDNNKTMQMNLELFCNGDGDRDLDNDVSDITYLGWSADTCTHTVSLKSEHACYLFSTNQLFRYLEKYWYIFGSIMIFFGLLVGFLGSKLI